MRDLVVFVLVGLVTVAAFARLRRPVRVDDRTMRRLAEVVDRGELRVVHTTMDALPARCRRPVDELLGAGFHLAGCIRTHPGRLAPTVAATLTPSRSARYFDLRSVGRCSKE